MCVSHTLTHANAHTHARTHTHSESWSLSQSLSTSGFRRRKTADYGAGLNQRAGFKGVKLLVPNLKSNNVRNFTIKYTFYFLDRCVNDVSPELTFLEHKSSVSTCFD